MISQVQVGLVAIILIIPLLSFGLWNSDSPVLYEKTEGRSKIIAFASFYPLYEFTEEIGGDKVDVSLLVPQGIEPHDWEPTIQDLQKLKQADAIIINGIGFENWIHDINSLNLDAEIIDTSVGISIFETQKDVVEDLESHDEFMVDPHIWLNPVMAQKQVQNIADSFSKIDPKNEKYYKQNAASYNNKLKDLDSKIVKELTSCKKDFIAFHNAFSYFAGQYDLTQHNIIKSNEPHEEVTSKSLEEIINLAIKLNSTVIFTEEAVDKRASQVISDEIGGKVLTLSPLEVMDPQSNYIKKMEENLSHLKEALCN